MPKDDLLIIAFVIFCAFAMMLLNPFIWQSFRNAKYWDKKKKHDKNTKDIKR